MKTLIQSFREQLDLPAKPEESPKVQEVLEHLSVKFQECAEDPTKVTAFHDLWEKVRLTPRDEAGNPLFDPNITSTITLDKIQKW